MIKFCIIITAAFEQVGGNLLFSGSHLSTFNVFYPSAIKAVGYRDRQRAGGWT